MGFEYKITIRRADTEVTAYKNGSFFDRKFIRKDETLEWVEKLMAKKGIKLDDMKHYLKMFNAKAISIKEPTDE